MSLNSSLGTIVELIGLGLAGAIIALGGIPLAIFIDMATFFMSAFIISLIKAKARRSEQASTSLKDSVQALKEGFCYVKNNKVIRTFFLITFLTNGLLVPMNSLQAPLVSEVYHQGELMLSALGITFSIGMLCGSVIYPILAQKISSKILMNLGGVVFGIYSIGLIAVEPLRSNNIALYGIVGFISIIAGIGIGFMISVLNIGFMKNVDEEYIARAGAILNSIAVAAIPIVSVMISIMVKVISVQLVFSITGILTIVTFFSFTFNKKLIL
jgi:Na+/melibiose symporter-like transporter